MTGHGRGEIRTKTWSAVVECHSVNRKTADISLHCDRSAFWLEPAVREKVLSKIGRGRVQVNLTLSRNAGGKEPFFDESRAIAFVAQARHLQKRLGLEGGVTLSDVLAAPGVTRSSEPAGEAAKTTALSALDEALKGLLETRKCEGAALQKILAKSVNRLSAILKKITPLARKVSATHREALLKRIEKAGLRLQQDDARLAAEVAFFAERSDITEELERASCHIAQFIEKLAANGPVGRTLEFLAQELGREFNTLGSKSSSTMISRHVIEAKAELDRIREQLANVE